MSVRAISIAEIHESSSRDDVILSSFKIVSKKICQNMQRKSQ